MTYQQFRLSQLEQSRLGRKAKALLSLKGTKPLRNQQRRIVERYQSRRMNLLKSAA